MESVPLQSEIEQKNHRPKIYFELTAKTFLKFLGFLLIVAAVIVLHRLIMLIFMGMLLAGALAPVVKKLHAKGIPRTATISVIAILISLLSAGFAFYVIPEIFSQVTDLIKNFSKVKDQAVHFLPADGPFRQMARQLIGNSKYLGSEEMLVHSLTFASEAMSGMIETFLVLVFCIYLLVDNGRAYIWLRDFFRAAIRQKLDKTAEEISDIVVGYVTAQVVTSALAGIYTYIAMTLLNVPLALTLAFLAAIFDVLPVLGFFLAVVPAVILGMTVSPLVGLATLGAYMFYHAIENYLIIPMIYGNRMKISSLVVLVSLLAAGVLGGVLPMIIILPIVAAYPVIEKIWLKPYLGDRVVEKHTAEVKA